MCRNLKRRSACFVQRDRFRTELNVGRLTPTNVTFAPAGSFAGIAVNEAMPGTAARQSSTVSLRRSARTRQHQVGIRPPA